MVIGEVTAGAANSGRGYPINDTFEILVSNGLLLTSASRRNWEGTGVMPDVTVPAADALSVAHLRAIDDLLAALPAGSKRDALVKVRAEIASRGREAWHRDELGESKDSLGFASKPHVARTQLPVITVLISAASIVDEGGAR
jgi:hypothetical protein